MNKYLLIVIGVGIAFGLVYLYGESRYSTGFAVAEKRMSDQVARLSKAHAEALARAIEANRKKEIEFHAKLSKLRDIKDTTGCLDRPLPPDYDRGLRDLYPGKR